MKALFLDQSTDVTGFCVAEPHHLITFGMSKAQGSLSVEERLHSLHKDVLYLIAGHEGIRAVVLEDNRFMQRSRTTSYAMNGSMAVCHIAAVEHGCRIDSMDPRSIKLAATGSGKASKEEMTDMAQRIWDIPEPPNHNTADALCLAYAWFVREGLW